MSTPLRVHGVLCLVELGAKFFQQAIPSCHIYQMVLVTTLEENIGVSISDFRVDKGMSTKDKNKKTTLLRYVTFVLQVILEKWIDNT